MAAQIQSVTLTPNPVNASGSLTISVAATFDIYFNDLDAMTWDLVDTTRALTWVDVDSTE